MENLIIIGARGYGRDACDIAKSMSVYGKEFVIKGFLDDKADALNDYFNYPPILGSVENYQLQENDVFICALGDVNYKKKYASIILEKGGVFRNIIHPTAVIGNNTKIGKGCIINAFSFIDVDVVISDFVSIQVGVVIGHDTTIGRWSMLDCHTFTGGFSTLGEMVTLHTSALVVPKVTIGNGATINAGSVVIRDIKENAVVMGNPAKQMIIPNIK